MSPRLGEVILASQSDERLVKLVRAGHERAFAVIVERYGPELSALARRLSPDGKAEDIVQQAFLSAFSALRAGADVNHLRGWLYRIVRNAAARSQVPLVMPLDGATASDESVEDVVQQRALAVDALAELARLPRRQRQAIVGTALDGRGRAEVATSMGVTEGAVRQLVHRARARIRTAVTAVTPLPLLRWLTPAHAANGGAVNVAAGVGTAAASSGAALKLGVVLASGAIATGVAVDIHAGAHAPDRAGPLAAAPVVHPRAAPDDDQVLTVAVVARVPVRADRPPQSRSAGAMAVAAPTVRARRGGDLSTALAERHNGGGAADSTVGSDRGSARGPRVGGGAWSQPGGGGGSGPGRGAAHPGGGGGSRPGNGGGSGPIDGAGSHSGGGGGSGSGRGPASGQAHGLSGQGGRGGWQNNDGPRYGGGGQGRDGQSFSGPVAVIAGGSGSAYGGHPDGFGGSGGGPGSGSHAGSGAGPGSGYRAGPGPGPGSGSHAGSGPGAGSGYGAGPGSAPAPASAPGSGYGAGAGTGSAPGAAADSGSGAGFRTGSGSGSGPGSGSSASPGAAQASGSSASPGAGQGGSSSPVGGSGH